MDGKTFVSKVDVVLKEKNLKRQAVADYCGVTVQAFTEWNKRGNLPAVNIARKIAKFLGVSLDWLLEDDYEHEWKDYVNLSDPTSLNLSPIEVRERINLSLRQRHSFTYTEDESFFSEILDILSFDQLNAMAKNRFEPRMVQLYEVSKRLEVPLDWLITGRHDENIPEPDIFIYNIAIRHSAFLKTYHSLSDANRKIIDSMALRLLENMNKIRMAIRDGTPLDDIPELN